MATAEHKSPKIVAVAELSLTLIERLDALRKETEFIYEEHCRLAEFVRALPAGREVARQPQSLVSAEQEDLQHFRSALTDEVLLALLSMLHYSGHRTGLGNAIVSYRLKQFKHTLAKAGYEVEEYTTSVIGRPLSEDL